MQIETDWAQICLSCHRWEPHPGGNMAMFSGGKPPDHLVVPDAKIHQRLAMMTQQNNLDMPLEPETGIEHRQEGQDGVLPANAADLQESISSRLVAVIEREMTTIIEQIPAHESKLTVLQRSLRFALPELVRLRLQEDPAGDSDDDSDDPADAES